MAKITVQPDCGNAPRKLFLKDLYVAWAKGDLKFFEAVLPDSFAWDIVGQSGIEGKENFLKAMIRHQLWKPKELIIDTIITHSRDASVSGRVVIKNNLIYSFCDVFRFKGASGAAIQGIKTFIVRHK